MLKKNTFKIILSSLIILLPVVYGILMWNDLPDMMTTHWGADGNADGVGGKVFAVFGLPAILLALHFVCLLFTLLICNVFREVLAIISSNIFSIFTFLQGYKLDVH